MMARERVQKEMECRELAGLLGCHIEPGIYERDDGGEDPIFFVYGPMDLYASLGTGTGDDPPLRADPLDRTGEKGSWKRENWEEVRIALDVYQEDLFLHRLGLPASSSSAACLRACPFWEAWWRTGEWERGAVLADWMEENGDREGIEVARLVRRKIAEPGWGLSLLYTPFPLPSPQTPESGGEEGEFGPHT